MLARVLFAPNLRRGGMPSSAKPQAFGDVGGSVKGSCPDAKSIKDQKALTPDPGDAGDCGGTRADAPRNTRASRRSWGAIRIITELGIFSVMWSEHCSYKSSRVHLKRLPTSGKRVVQGPGENAGVVDIGDGFAPFSKSSRTIIRVLWSRFRERRPGWAEFCAIFSRWVRGRLR